MKKLFKIFIFILLICFCFRVDAKTLVEKTSLASYEDYINLSGDFFISEDDSFIISNFGSEYLDSSNLISNGQFNRFNYSGEIIESSLLDDNSFFVNGIELDDNYIFVGGTYNNMYNLTESYYPFISKTDKKGNIIWSKNINIDSQGVLINAIQTKDNNIVAVGCFFDSLYSGYFYGFVVKFDSKGNVIWTYKSTNYDSDFRCVIETQSGNLLVPYNYADTSLSYLVFSSDGELLKETPINTNISHGSNFIYVNDDYICIEGTYLENNISYGVLIVTDVNGNVLHETRIEKYVFQDVIRSKNGSIIVYCLDSYNVLKDRFVIKYDSQLNELWNYKFSDDNDYYFISSLHELDNGTIISLCKNDDNILINKFDSTGNLIGDTVIISSKLNLYTVNDAVINDDGSYAVVGFDYFNQAPVLRYFDKNSKMVWSYSTGGVDKEYFTRIIKTPSDKYFAKGVLDLNYSFESYDKNGIYVNGITYTYDATNSTPRDKFDRFISIDNNQILTASGQAKSILVCKYDENFNKISSFVYNVIDNDDYYNEIFDVFYSSDNYIFVLARYRFNYSEYSYKYYILKLDVEGNLIARYDFIGSGYDTFGGIVETDDHNYLVAGRFDISDGFSPYILKFNGNLELISSKKVIPTLKSGSEWENYQITSMRIDDIIKLKDDLYVVGTLTDFRNDRLYVESIEFIDSNLNTIYETQFAGDSHLFYSQYRFLDAHVLFDDTIRLLFSSCRSEGCEGYRFLLDIYYNYDLIPKSSSNGSFTINKEVAKNKEIITLNVYPKSGYMFDKVILTDTKGNKTEFKDLTFEMIPDDVEIEVVFKKLINPATGFSLISIFAIVGGLIFITIRSRKKSEV